MAASAALRAVPAIRISVISTPKKKPKPSPPNRPVRTYLPSFLSTNLLSACDLSSAMARLFSAVAQGQIKPKVASTLAYLSQTMIQSIPIAQHEYCEAFSSDAWRRAIRSSFTPSAPVSKPASQPAPPAPLPASQVPPHLTSQPAPPAVPNPINIDQTS